MDQQTNLLMNISVLYRSTQKYYDRNLQDLHLTYAQIPILIMIYENEGISMRDISQIGVYDKGTISKSVKHLEQQGFICVRSSKVDKRNKELYTSDFAKQSMAQVYSIRRDWWQHLMQGIDDVSFRQFLPSYDRMANNAKEYAESIASQLPFFHWQKVSLTHYPHKLSTVLYTAGSNFRCPFDRYPELIFIQEGMKELSRQEIIEYLENRRNVLEAVCIAGGEPMMDPRLSDFLALIKSMGYFVKVTTNGSFPDRLETLIQKKCIDFVSLDIKNSPGQYAKSIGMEHFDIQPIEKTLNILRKDFIDYQIELYLNQEYHTMASLKSLAKWLSGMKKIVLHTDIESLPTVSKQLHNFNPIQIDKIVQLFQEQKLEVEVQAK